MRLNNKVAVVTGAGQGVAMSIAQRFGAEGAYVVVIDARGDSARIVEEAVISSGGKAHAVTADVTDSGVIHAALEHVAKKLGHIDILVNGAELREPPDVADYSIDHLKKMLETNLLGAVICSRAVFPYMRGQRAGSIINLGSYESYAPGSRGIDGPEQDILPISAYGLSKSGLVYLTKAMAQHMGGYKVRVNHLCTGLALTDMEKKLHGPKVFDTYARASAMNRVLEPGDAAGAAVFLASDDSALMTGQTVMLDAGHFMMG